MKKLLALLVVSVLLAGCVGSVVKPKVEDGIARALPEYIGPAKSYEVHTSASTAEMIGGDLDTLKIEGVDVQVDPDLVISKLYIEMQGVQADPNKRTLKSVKSTLIRATITGPAINKYIAQTRGDDTLSLKLDKGKIIVHFKPTVGGVGVPLAISGKPVIVKGDKVNFEADAAALGKVPVPAYVINKGLERMNPVLDLSVLNFPVTLKEIVLNKGSVDVHGTADFKPEAK